MKRIKHPLITILTSILLTSPASAEKSPFSDEQICKATISLLMMQKPSIMSAETSGDEVTVTYEAPTDGAIYINKCKIDKSNKTIVWAAKWRGEWGAWTDSIYDPVISYSIKRKKLTVSKGSRSKVYTLKDF